MSKVQRSMMDMADSYFCATVAVTTERFKDCGDGISKQRGGIDDGDGCGFGDLRVEVVKLRLHLLPGGFIGFQRLDAV